MNKMSKISEDIIKLIKNNCKPFLKEIKKGNCLYSQKSNNKIISKSNESCHDLSNNIVAVLTNVMSKCQNPIDIKNSIIGYSQPINHTIPQVLIPIGDFKILWSEDFSDFNDLSEINEDFYTPLEDKIRDSKREIRDKIIKNIKDDLYNDTIDKIETKWRSYLLNKAEEHVYNMADNDPDKYKQDTIDHLVDKWMKFYNKNINLETEEKVNKMLFDEEIVSKISALVQKNIDTKLNQPKYFELSEELFIQNRGGNLNTNNINKAIQLKKNIIIDCKEYFLIDENYYKMFIEEKLWH